MRGTGAFAHLDWAARSDVGKVRANNEDAYGAFPEHGIWCVADGMGGGEDGEVASSTLVRLLGNFLHSCPPKENVAYAMDEMLDGVRETLSDANDVIFRRSKTLGLRSCGSTFVGVCFNASFPSSALAVNVGDSRLYRIRDGAAEQITHDHTMGASLGLRESEVPAMFRGVLSRVIGVERQVESDVTPFDVAEGDVVLLCSDGLTHMVPDDRIAEIAGSSSAADDLADRLVDAALAAGGGDNVTVVAVRVGRLPDALPQVALQGEGDRDGGREVTLCGGDCAP